MTGRKLSKNEFIKHKCVGNGSICIFYTKMHCSLRSCKKERVRFNGL